MVIVMTTVPTMPPFLNLPHEIYLLVADHLDANDLFNLGLVCRQLSDVFRDNSLCRAHLQKNAPFARELSWPLPVGHNLRARTKRCRAIANLQPYAAAVIAYAENYIYMNNTLIYVCDRMLRMLYLGPNTTVRSERNVDIRAMLDAVLPESEGTSRYSFQPIHYAQGIMSCIYAHHRIGCAQENWLVFFNPETGWNLNCRIPFPHHRLFVRNNESHLIYGMFTSRTRITAADSPGDVAAANTTTDAQSGSDRFFETVADDGGDGHHRCWRMRHLDIAAKKWSDFDSHAMDPIVGLGEFGKDLCFEIIDGYFYAVASEQRFISREHETEYMSKMHKDDFYCADDPTEATDPDVLLQDQVFTQDDSYSGNFFVDDYTTGTQQRRPMNVANRSSSATGSSVSGSSKSEPIDLVVSQKDTTSSEQDSEQDSDDSDEPLSDGSDARFYPSVSSASRAALFRETSFFTCFRFRITNDLPVVEQPTLKSRWRRRHNEGALDERWATLKIQKSPETGEILVIEERREWLGNSSNSRRSYYMQPLVFASDLRARDLANRAQSASLSDRSPSPGYSPASSGRPSAPRKRKRLPLLSELVPEKRLAKNVHFGDNAALINPPTISDCYGRFYSRDAATFIDLVNMNQNSTGGSPQIGLRAGSRVLSLENKADSAAGSDDDNIQVDAVSERLPEYDNAQAERDSKKPAKTYPKYPIAEMTNAYVPSDLSTWPKQPKEEVDPAPDASDHPDRRKYGVHNTKPALEPSEKTKAESDVAPNKTPNVKPDEVPAAKMELTEAERAENDLLGPVLNPPGCTGSITSTWDERLLVYSTKMGSLIPNLPVRSKPRPVRAIVMVSFDPTLCLPGLKIWQDAKQGCEPRLAQGKDQHILQSQQSKATDTAQEEEDTAAGEALANMAPRWVSTADAGIRNGFDFSYHVKA